MNYDIFKNINIFKNLTALEIEKIASLFEEKSFNKGDIIFEEGSRDSSLYIVVKGTVKIIKELTPESQKTLASLSDNNVFGELSLFDDYPRSATAVVSEPSKIILVDGKRFRNFIDTETGISTKILKEIIKEISKRLRETNEKLQEHISWGLIAKL